MLEIRNQNIWCSAGLHYTGSTQLSTLYVLSLVILSAPREGALSQIRKLRPRQGSPMLMVVQLKIGAVGI